MDTWEQIKFIWDLEDQQTKNSRLEFLRNYKVSVPTIALIISVFCMLGYLLVFAGPDLIVFAKEGADQYLVPYRSNFIFAGLLLLFATIYIALFIGVFSKAFRLADRALIFPAPLHRKNLVRAKYLRASIWMFLTGTLFLMLFYMGSIPFVGFSMRPFTIIFVILVITHSFTNIQLFYSHVSYKFKHNKLWKIIDGTMGAVVAVALAVPMAISFYMLYIQQFEVEFLLVVFLSEPYNLLLAIPYVGACLVVGHNPVHVDAIFWGTLILLDVITTIIFWKTNYFIWEDNLTVVRQTEMRPLGEIRYEGRERRPTPGWWRKGPFKDLRWELPQTGLGLEALMAKNLLLSRRESILLFIRGMLLAMAISFFFIFFPSNFSFYYDPFPMVWGMILMMVGGVMVSYYMPMKEGRRLEMMKIMPFSGREMILSFLTPQMKGTFIPYLILSTMAFLFAGHFTLSNVLLLIFVGPSVLLGVISYLYYLYFATLHRVEMSKAGQEGSPIFMVGAFSLMFIYFALFFVLMLLSRYLDTLLLIVLAGAIHCSLAVIFLPASFKAYERTEIKA